MNNTQKGAQTGQTRQIRQIRDADDRTMQLDSLGTHFARRDHSGPVLPELSTDDGNGPVFVDESGRRGKKFRRAGWILGAICAVYAAMLVASLIGGNSFAPGGMLIPGISASDEKADKVKSEPSATPSVPKSDELPPVGGNQQAGNPADPTPGANDKVPAGGTKKPDPKDSPAGTKPPVELPGKPGGGVAAAGGGVAAAGGGAAVAGGAAAGGTTPGDAAAGGTTPGDAAAGGTTPGDAAAGGTTPGDAAAGGTTPGDAAAGGTTPGDAAAGGTTPGEAAAGETPTSP
ncbi:hypothetical protein [Streptomyces sp. NPDC051561]|uniref:hypothetical protein n=1 Tax=Streptomyces sp. NPDC051561 TaxID=3365658 RepID=UPI0037B3D9B7